MIQPHTNSSPDGRGPNGARRLISPHPLGGYLPALYQEDDFAQRWTSGLDMVLAPIFGAMDNFEAYLDPGLAPVDFLDWLATWMGLVADETWPVERRRAFVSQASALYRIRGTPKGLATHVQLFSGGEVEILERGGTAWSVTTGAALPGSQGYDMVVRVRVDDPGSVDVARLDALVGAAKPAHLAHKVEVVGAAPVPSPRRARASAATESPRQVASEEPPPGAPAGPPPDGDAPPPEPTP